MAINPSVFNSPSSPSTALKKVMYDTKVEPENRMKAACALLQAEALEKQTKALEKVADAIKKASGDITFEMGRARR